LVFDSRWIDAVTARRGKGRSVARLNWTGAILKGWGQVNDFARFPVVRMSQRLGASCRRLWRFHGVCL